MRTLVIGNKNYSSWSLRAWWHLRRRGVAFAEKRLAMDTPDFAPAIGAHFSGGKVPALVEENGAEIWDSLAIIRYADAHLCSPAAVEKAAENAAWSYAAEMHASFYSLRREMPMNCRRAPKPLAEVSAKTEKDIKRIQELWRRARAEWGGGGAWLFDGYTLADAMFAPVALRFYAYAVPLEKECARYVDHILADADIAAWREAAAQEKEVIAAEER